MSKHTEGPWEVNGYVHDSVRKVRVSQGGLLVADCFVSDRSQEEQEANARLIAAAPDLLDACKTAIQQCTTLLVSQGWNERWDSITGGEWAGPVIMNIMRAADAAIAKAEGGQQ